MNWKKIAKNSSLLYWVNARLKCYTLKRERSKLEKAYNLMAYSQEYSYDPDRAINAFKQRHARYCPNYGKQPMGHLKVFWVGTCQSQDESGFLQALQRLSKVTVFIDCQGNYGIWGGCTAGGDHASLAAVRSANDECLLRQIHEAHAKQGIDVLIGQMWANLVSREALQQAQAMGIPVINIAMDDRLPLHWAYREGIRMGSVGLIPGIDMALTTSPETCLWYGLEGCPALFWPLASDPALFAAPPEANRDIAVLFIGNRYGVRGQIVDYLQRHGVQVDCYGSGWPNGYVDAEQNAALSRRARIILGVGTVGHCRDVYTLKLRDFDAMMTGALYITHRNPDLCRLFNEGDEFECYTTPKEALAKIRYYLDHDAERQRIGRAGQAKARLRDTWDERLSMTFEQLGLLTS